MNARPYHHLTNDQKAAVQSAFDKTHPGAPYTKRVVESFRAASVPIRKPDGRGVYYPYFFPWLKAPKSRQRSAVSGQQDAKKTAAKKTAISGQPAECRLLNAESSLSSSVRSLADALVKFVLAEVTESLQQSALSLQPSVASLQPATAPAAAAPAERRPLTAESSSSSLHSLSDQQLKDRLGVAKASNNIGLCAKITNVLRMRDRSATVIANTHQEEA
jgi:hypothetical protein